MAPWLFTEAILASKPIKVFNHGKLQRDFTYIDDIVEGVIRIFEQPPTGAEKHTVYNIGNHQPVELMDFIGELEKALGKEAEKTYLPMQEGDVLITYADTKKLREAIGFAPSTPLKKGIKDFVDWYQAYHAEKDI
jgi:UDP-glucuronate 4-epimerase